MTTRLAKARRGLSICAVIVGWAATGVSAQSGSRAEIEAELTAALERYVAAFSDGRLDFLADSVYTAPAYFFGSGGVEARTTRDDVRARFEEMLAPLPAQGYDRSEIRGSDACVLSDSAAMVTLRFARVRRDGGVLLEGTARYLYANTPAGWRIVASLGSSPGFACAYVTPR